MSHHIDDGEPYVVIERRSSGIGGFLAGAAIGAGLALLMAPQSGLRTRRAIRRRARRASEAAERVATEVTGSVVDTFTDARRRVEEQIDHARQTIELKKRQVQRAVEAGREAADEARFDLEKRIAESKAAAADGEHRRAAAGEGGAT